MSAAQARLQKDLGTKCRKIAACMRMRHRAGMREVMQMNTTHEIMPGVTYTIECIGIVLASSAPLFLSAALRVAFLGLGGIGGILILTPPPRAPTASTVVPCCACWSWCLERSRSERLGATVRAAPLGAAGSPAVKGSRNLVSAALRRPRRVLMVFPRGVGTAGPARARARRRRAAVT